MPLASPANNPKQGSSRMRSLICWMLVSIVVLAASACGTVSRFLAGMDDPMYFTWEKSSDIPTRNNPAPASTTTRETRQRIPGLLSEDALALPQAPAPVAPPVESKGLAQDLRDCEAPTLQAPTAASVPGTPTIERSDSSHVVAECMAEKGYRKNYSPLGATFP
jgi:hypothetical protein